MPKLKAPEGSTGCSFGGMEYSVVDGVVDVPTEAVVDLLNHGYIPAPIVAPNPSQEELDAIAKRNAEVEKDLAAKKEAVDKESAEKLAAANKSTTTKK